jgi:hypothetical protein
MIDRIDRWLRVSRGNQLRAILALAALVLAVNLAAARFAA